MCFVKCMCVCFVKCMCVCFVSCLCVCLCSSFDLQQGEARVAAFDSSASMLVVSKPSSNQLLPGFGLLKVSGLELRSSEFVSIHQGVLRDVVFGPEGDGLVLTAAMDKTMKLTSMVSNTVVQR